MQVVILAGNPRQIKLAGLLVALCVDCGNTISLCPYYDLSHQNYLKSDFKSDSNVCHFIFPAVTVLQPSKKPEIAKKCHFRQKLASLAVIQMPKVQPTSFRIPSSHLVFLELLAKQNQTNRTQELCKILDDAIARYTNASQKKTQVR